MEASVNTTAEPPKVSLKTNSNGATKNNSANSTPKKLILLKRDTGVNSRGHNARKLPRDAPASAVLGISNRVSESRISGIHVSKTSPTSSSNVTSRIDSTGVTSGDNRTGTSSNSGSVGSSSATVVAKSLEERTKEYHEARARIFGTNSLSSSSASPSGTACAPNARSSANTSNSASIHNDRNDPAYIRNHGLRPPQPHPQLPPHSNYIRPPQATSMVKQPPIASPQTGHNPCLAGYGSVPMRPPLLQGDFSMMPGSVKSGLIGGSQRSIPPTMTSTEGPRSDSKRLPVVCVPSYGATNPVDFKFLSRPDNTVYYSMPTPTVNQPNMATNNSNLSRLGNQSSSSNPLSVQSVPQQGYLPSGDIISIDNKGVPLNNPLINTIPLQPDINCVRAGSPPFYHATPIEYPASIHNSTGDVRNQPASLLLAGSCNYPLIDPSFETAEYSISDAEAYVRLAAQHQLQYTEQLGTPLGMESTIEDNGLFRRKSQLRRFDAIDPDYKRDISIFARRFDRDNLNANDLPNSEYSKPQSYDSEFPPLG